MRFDTFIGMGYRFIIVSTAATLNAHGITNMQTSAGAAEALRPIAGAFNFVGLDPIKALFWPAVINGVVAVPQW
jgi:hypothetical protein